MNIDKFPESGNHSSIGNPESFLSRFDKATEFSFKESDIASMREAIRNASENERVGFLSLLHEKAKASVIPNNKYHKLYMTLEGTI